MVFMFENLQVYQKAVDLAHRILGLALLLLVPALPIPAWASTDPRATIIVLGDMNSLPVSLGPGWTTIIQRQHPDWNVQNLSDRNRLLPQLVEQIEQLLEPHRHVEVVVIFTGVADAAPKEYAATPADKLGEAMAALIGKIQKNPHSAKATILLCTPVPVIDARLDQWSVARFKGGQANSLAIAHAFKKVGEKTGVTVNDFQAWALAQEADGKPGMLLNSYGWLIRDWGHAIVAKYMDEALVKLKPASPDPAGLEQWRKVQVSQAALNQILHDTSEGTVDAEPGTFEVKATGKRAYSAVVPAKLLNGPTFDIVVRVKQGALAAVGCSVNQTEYQTRLEVVTAKGNVTIKLKATDWCMIEQARPDQAIPGDRYRFNRSKINYFGIASCEPGKQRWVVARFDLSALEGQTPTQAALTVGMPVLTYVQVADKTEELAGELDVPLVSPIVGRDTQWEPGRATWNTRDGQGGWTGGKVQAARRRVALQAFIASNPPDEVAAMAKAELAKLGA